MTVARSVRAEASRNERGSAADRRRRKAWLVENYRADVDAVLAWADPTVTPETKAVVVAVVSGTGEAACRCFRCGRLLTVNTLTVDRIVPGCQGGTYQRNNIRPACNACNSETGRELARQAVQKGTRT